MLIMCNIQQLNPKFRMADIHIMSVIHYKSIKLYIVFILQLM
jgi:hypothetical protein